MKTLPEMLKSGTFQLDFDNDGIGAAIQVANLAGDDALQEKTSQVIRKFVKWNGVHGTITVEIDIEAGTARVLPVG